MTDPHKPIVERIKYATGQYHDATEWGSACAPDGSGTLLDWICRAATLTTEQPVTLASLYGFEAGLAEAKGMAEKLAMAEKALEDLLRCFSTEGKHIAPSQGGHPDQFKSVASARATLSAIRADARGDHREG